MVDKTKEQLEQELSRARQRIAELERGQGAVEVSVFKDMVESSPDGFFATDMEPRLTYANRAAHEMFGCDCETQGMVGRMGTDFWPEQDLPFLTETVLPQVMAGGWQGQVRQKRQDGTVFDASALVFPLLDAEGQPVGLVSTVRDITERKAAEAELLRLQSAIDQTGEGIAVADMDGNIVYANPAWAEVHGYTLDEIRGKHLGMFHTEEQIEQDVIPFNEKAMATGAHSGQVGHARKDGTTFPTLMTSTVLKDEAGNPVGMVGTVRDITESKRAEEEMQKLAMVVKHSGELIALGSLDTKIIFLNEAGSRILGIDPAEVEQYALADVVAEEYAEVAQNEFMPTLMSKGAWEGELGYRNLKTGEITHMYINTRVITDPETGAPLYLSNISRDITDLKRGQEERERLQQKVIEAHQQALKELATPIIPVMDRILIMPLVGSVDSMRARDITRAMLAGIREHRAQVVILDITGVSIVDSGVANHLNKTIQAARLKGARTIITGISDAVAETIVDLGIDWSGIDTLNDLQTGLVVALGSLGIKLSKA